MTYTAMRLFFLSLSLIATNSVVLANSSEPTAAWQLVWQDEFNEEGAPDPEKWSRCRRGRANWNHYMSDDPDLAKVSEGRLHLRGVVNPNQDASPVPFLTGGVHSMGKFDFALGKIEIKARFEPAQGAWPAIWMLAANRHHGRYPHNGEIDLMEHLNFDEYVYQTVHTHYTLNIDKTKAIPSHARAKINQRDWNIYGLIWTEQNLQFTVNGKTTFTYAKQDDKGPVQYPFDQPFYLIMSMQVEGSWVGKANSEHYPAGMEIDWVRVYSNTQANTGGSAITRQDLPRHSIAN